VTFARIDLVGPYLEPSRSAAPYTVANAQDAAIGLPNANEVSRGLLPHLDHRAVLRQQVSRTKDSMNGFTRDREGDREGDEEAVA
jgi:hypothetical protein